AWLGGPLAFGLDWLEWLTRTHPLLPLALAAIALAWRRRGRALGMVGLVLLAHPLAMAVLAPYRGPGFQEGRYSIHLLPVGLLLLAVALGPWEGHARAAWLVRVVYLAVALVTLAPA